MIVMSDGIVTPKDKFMADEMGENIVGPPSAIANFAGVAFGNNSFGVNNTINFAP